MMVWPSAVKFELNFLIKVESKIDLSDNKAMWEEIDFDDNETF